MNQDFAFESRFLTRHSKILKRRFLEGEIDKEKFLGQGLLELLEAIEKGGLEGDVFNSRDNTYHEVLMFIKKNYPDFNTDFYENVYEKMISNYCRGVQKRTAGERTKSLRKFREEKYHNITLRYKEPIKVLI